MACSWKKFGDALFLLPHCFIARIETLAHSEQILRTHKMNYPKRH